MTKSFISDPELPTIKLNLDHDSRDNLWGKTKQAFQYVYENYKYELQSRSLNLPAYIIQ